MPANFKVGDAVQQVMPAPVKGKVLRMGMVDDELGYLIEEENGAHRWFRESSLEAQPKAPTEGEEVAS